MLVTELRDLLRGWSSKSWALGEAVIIASAVEEREGAKWSTWFEPTIEYRYSFRGVEYVGRRLRFGGVRNSTRAEAEKVAAEHATGTTRKVSISERHPEISVLHPGVSGRLWYNVVFFVGYTIMTIWFVVIAVRTLHV
jgi:hypothetical protein